jgi:hypothetical protein
MSYTLGVDMVLTGHSLGRNKLDHLLKSGEDAGGCVGRLHQHLDGTPGQGLQKSAGKRREGYWAYYFMPLSWFAAVQSRRAGSCFLSWSRHLHSFVQPAWPKKGSSTHLFCVVVHSNPCRNHVTCRD